MPLTSITKTAAWQRYSYRLPLIALLLNLITGATIVVVSNWQSSQLATAEGNLIGQTLSVQLAEAVRRPILNNDLVSLQVGVEHAANYSDVFRAAVVDANRVVLAERKNSSPFSALELSHHKVPVTIDGATAAYAELEINLSAIMKRNRESLSWVIGIWLLFSLLSTALAALQGRNLSRRFTELSQQLPEEESQTYCHDELDMIEQQLAPLLTQPDESQSTNIEHSSLNFCPEIATVALHCKNLDRLEALLTRENMQRIFTQIDHNLTKVAKLYSGTRLSSHNQTLFIEFTGESLADDHPLRALFCATILLQLVSRQAELLGLSIELSAAVTLFQTTNTAPLKAEFEQEKRQQQAIQLAKLAADGELLTDLSTYQHSSVASKINADEFAGKPNILAVTSFSKVYTSLMEKQFLYLTMKKTTTP